MVLKWIILTTRLGETVFNSLLTFFYFSFLFGLLFNRCHILDFFQIFLVKYYNNINNIFFLFSLSSISHPSGEKVPVGKDNLLLRECVLKNTTFVEGLVAYAGKESKTMLNNGGPRFVLKNVYNITCKIEIIGCTFKPNFGIFLYIFTKKFGKKLTQNVHNFRK